MTLPSRLLQFYFFYWLFWLGYFLVARVVFLLFNIQKVVTLEDGAWSSIFVQGCRIDLSTVGYVMVIPTLLFGLVYFLKSNWVSIFLRNYTLALLLLFSFFVVTDASLYGHWGNKLDVYGFVYLNNVSEVINFIPVLTLLTNSLIFLLLVLSFYALYKKKLQPPIKDDAPLPKTTPVVFLVLIIFSIIPIRGGIGLTPLNLSNIYFSKNVFANHCAINVLWNVGYTFSEREKLYQRQQYISESKATTLFNTLYPSESATTKLLSNSKPDIVFIILESFTSKLINKKWNGIEITPHLNQLVKEGVYFSNFYASGDRTDEGLVSILSGYPAQPLSFIINYQSKTAKLPSLIKDLKKEGYQTALYYGGDINFANMKSYLLQTGTEKIVDKRDFPPSQFNAKWGVHDHFVFDKLLAEIASAPSPFFKVMLSLSSHPPFDTPIPTVIQGSDENSLFANSANYTDQALGNFISAFRQTKQWQNTLLVISADHSIPYLDECDISAPEKYKIPMLWLGGAVKNKDTVITKISSQTDIVNTLLEQLNISTSDYQFSKNILSPNSQSFSFYTFNHGYGFLSDGFKRIYDYNGKKFLEKIGTTWPDSIGHAYLQKVMMDYSSK